MQTVQTTLFAIQHNQSIAIPLSIFLRKKKQLHKKQNLSLSGKNVHNTG